MAQETAATIQVEVQLPDLTKKLIATLKAIMELPEHWGKYSTITVADLGTAMMNNLLPDGEHNEEVCSTGLINCPECAAAR